MIADYVAYLLALVICINAILIAHWQSCHYCGCLCCWFVFRLCERCLALINDRLRWWLPLPLFHLLIFWVTHASLWTGLEIKFLRVTMLALRCMSIWFQLRHKVPIFAYHPRLYLTTISLRIVHQYLALWWVGRSCGPFHSISSIRLHLVFSIVSLAKDALLALGIPGEQVLLHLGKVRLWHGDVLCWGSEQHVSAGASMLRLTAEEAVFGVILMLWGEVAPKDWWEHVWLPSLDHLNCIIFFDHLVIGEYLVLLWYVTFAGIKVWRD